jgi:hypothetical protein
MMAETDINSILQAIPSEQREVVSQLLTATVKNVAEKYENDIAALKSSADKARSAARKADRDAQRQLLETASSGTGNSLPNELGRNVADLEKEWEHEDSMEKLRGQLGDLELRNTGLESELLNVAKKSAITGGVPEDIVNRADSRKGLDDLTALHKAFGSNNSSNNGSGNSENSPTTGTVGGTGTLQGGGNGAGSSPQSDLERATEATSVLRG